jgi:hypothetical protein
MGVGSASVVDYANTYPGTASHVNATGSVGDFEVVVDGSGATTLSLNFQTATSLDPRITFSRTSNATLVDSNGLIQYAPHNLLTYSEQFDNAAWTKTAVTVSTNTITAPDGTTTAATVVYSGASVTPLQTITSATTTYTISTYVKSNNTSFCRLRVTAVGGGSTSFSSYFNIITGVITSTGTTTADFGSLLPSITSVGNGWYRISVTFTVLSVLTSITYGIVAAQTSGGASAAGDELYAWGAQLNEGALQPYYSTTVKNLLGYSQNFENAAWTKSNSSIAASTVIGPFGFDGGEKLVEDSATNTHLTQQTPTFALGSVYTQSVYAKAGERTFLQLRSTSLATFSASFDLVNGTYSQVTANTVASINSIGNGWFRCSITFTAGATGASAARVAIMQNATTQSYTGDGTSGIYIFGAQLSDSASLDPYSYNPVAAPTSTAYYGPRFDYDPATLAPKGLLIEEQRTNLLTYSSEFDNAAWLKLASTTVTANTVTSPDGMVNADTVALVGAAQGIYQSATVTASTVYTASVYVKLGTLSVSEYKIAIYNATAGAFIATDITPTAVVSSSGWARIDYTFTTPVGCLSIRFYPVRNSASVNGTVYLYGAQLELGAFPTSYILTTSATVTRAADIASMVGSNFSSWYNQSEGTFVTSFDMYYATGTIGAFPRVISVSNGSSANLIDIQSTQYNNENMTIVDTSVQQCSINATQFAANTTGKFAGSFATNNFQISANGVLGIADTVGTVPTVNQMQIGNRWDLIRPMSGHIQSIKYYPTRLPNGTLQGLTA